MTLTTRTLRPGFLVSLKTSIRGNVTYRKNVIEEAHLTDTGTQQAKWETERTIAVPEEHELAKQTRSKAASFIRGVCAQSAFGLLCPQADGEKLERAMADARKVVDQFNAAADITRVDVYILIGRVMPDDMEAVRAISSEIRELMAEMSTGIENKNVEAIRDAATRVKGIGQMLEAEARDKVQSAVETARATAKQMVKDGDQAAVDKSAVRRITELRAAFIDLDEATPVTAPKARPRRPVDLEAAE
jgi:hypothetical protein